VITGLVGDYQDYQDYQDYEELNDCTGEGRSLLRAIRVEVASAVLGVPVLGDDRRAREPARAFQRQSYKRDFTCGSSVFKTLPSRNHG
jgi:hypothetical protein